ncbi:MAG: choice-of-anchor tandem repeat NxxGxxAF-containing protein [Verrucomicrobiota bacterium]
MKRTLLLAFVPLLVSLSSLKAQSYTTLVSEDFASGLPASLEQTGASVTFAGANATFNGVTETSRSYLRTKTTTGDFFATSFVAEVTLIHNQETIAFFGLGVGQADPGLTYEPEYPSINLRAHAEGLGDDSTHVSDDGDVTTPISLGSGTHRLRLIWNATAKTATYQFDQNYNGVTFNVDATSVVVDGSDNGFNSTNARIFFGGTGATFDDFLIQILEEPLIAISGNSLPITNGDPLPSPANHTDFGDASIAGGTVVRTFTITNAGDADLTLTGTAPNYVTLSGSGDFAVTAQPAASVAASTTTTFQVTFDPSSNGSKVAVVSIANNDDTASPFTFTIAGEVQPVSVPSALDDVVSDGGAPAADGSTSIGQYDVLRRGGFLAANGHLVFPGFLEISASAPVVTPATSSGLWKSSGGNISLLARTGTTVPNIPGATFSSLPETPGISAGGHASFLGSLSIGGSVTADNDTGVWSELGGTGLSLLLREDDDVPGLPGVKVAKFASGVYASATTGASTGEAALSVTFKGSNTKTAILRASVNGSIGVSVIAHEGTPAPGTAVSFANVAGSYSDPGRMDPQGNFVFAALTTPGNKEGIWFQPVTGGAPAKVIFAGETAPGTGGATFSRIKTPSIGSNGVIAFRASLNADGDNSGNTRNDGIWRVNASDLSGFQCILRRGDDSSVVSNLPALAKVGNPWSGWLNSNNRGAWKAWLDVNGDGNSVSPTDVHAIYTDLSGTMQLAVSQTGAAPGTAGASFASFDNPVLGGNNQFAIVGNLTGGDTTANNNQGLWKCAPNGGALSLVLRKGETIVTSEGSKIIQKIDLPSSNNTDRRWEQPVMDDAGRIIVQVTFTDGSTSHMIVL